MTASRLSGGRKNGLNQSPGEKDEDDTLRTESVAHLEGREHCEVQVQHEAVNEWCAKNAMPILVRGVVLLATPLSPCQIHLIGQESFSKCEPWLASIRNTKTITYLRSPHRSFEWYKRHSSLLDQ